uniref:Uncharacterized protein n=1 Tax=Coccidioides posadasii RMSCC 3488 TaxID=454284 RepID=A0A0J6HYZ7_COCPO|nr:hypothetical protein CPAG_00544 [Coccidioides posadasii RMSCC 3488]
MGRGNVAQSSISADGHRQTWTKSPIDDAYQASAAPIKTSDICQRGKGASFPRPPVTPKQDTVDCSDSAPYFVHSKPSPRCPFLSSVLTGLSVVQTPPETGFFLTSKGLRYGPSLSCQGFDAPLHIVTPKLCKEPSVRGCPPETETVARSTLAISPPPKMGH